jgi:hypothetical protein
LCDYADNNEKDIDKHRLVVKGVAKKRGVLNFITLAYVSSKKKIDIHFCCQGYENIKGLAIIQDFTAH